MTKLRPGDDVFGWCGGAFAEYASASEDHFLPKPARLTFEQAAGSASPPRQLFSSFATTARSSQARRCSSTARRVASDVRGADREGLRGRGDRRVQHPEHGPRPLDRRGSRDRLRPRRLHAGRPALRLHPRQRGQPRARADQARADSRWAGAAERRGACDWSLDRLAWSRLRGARVVDVQSPAAAPSSSSRTPRTWRP